MYRNIRVGILSGCNLLRFIHSLWFVLSQKLKLNTISYDANASITNSARRQPRVGDVLCACGSSAQPTANTSPRAEHEQPAVLRAVQEPGAGLSPVRHAPRHPDSITSQFRFSYLLGRSFSAMLYLATAHLTPQLSPPEASSSHIASASAACTAGCLRA